MTTAPLDNLVIAQLAAIRQREAALEQEIHTPTGLNRQAVESQLLELQQRADRLGRMIDAMSITNSAWFTEQTAPSVA